MWRKTYETNTEILYWYMETIKNSRIHSTIIFEIPEIHIFHNIPQNAWKMNYVDR